MEWPWALKMIIAVGLLLTPPTSMPIQFVQSALNDVSRSFGTPPDVHNWLAILAFFYFVYSMCRAIWSHYQHRYFIDQDGVEYRFGIISRDEKRVDFSNVTLINMRQSFMGRLFMIGDILVGTSATDQPEIEIQGISRPRHWKETLHEMQRTNRPNASEQSRA